MMIIKQVSDAFNEQLRTIAAKLLAKYVCTFPNKCSHNGPNKQMMIDGDLPKLPKTTILY